LKQGELRGLVYQEVLYNILSSISVRVNRGQKPDDLKGRTDMDFIERTLGWAPDGGDGSFELMLIVACGAVLVLSVFGRHILHILRGALRPKGSIFGRRQ
jgi:hypothetical protein